MQKIIIAAVAENRAIGKDNDLIWHLPADMHFFKTQTMGHPVIMGRRNYESIPARYRPLPGRLNIVLSRNEAFAAPGCEVFTTLKDATAFCESKGFKKAFIIGGGEIYNLALKEGLVDEMLITEVQATPDADAYFPLYDPSRWDTNTLAAHKPDEKHKYGFIIKHLKRKN
jgi:dihydrofolate reductase